MKIFIKKILVFFMWYPLRVFIMMLPFKLIYLIGAAGGRLLYLLSKEKCRIMSEELRLSLPSEKTGAIEAIVRGSLENYCLSEIGVLLYPNLNAELIKKMTVIEGREHLDNALSKGKGVLLFQAHFGAFQMTMPAIGYSGYKMNQISASADLWKDRNASEVQGEKTFGMKAKHEYTLPVSHISIKSSLRPAFRALENNEIVGITVDGGSSKKVIPIRFLGRDANFPHGGAEMAVKTGAVIITAFMITEKDFRHRLILHPPIEVADNLDKEERIIKIVKDFAKILEGYVYKYPAHYGYYLYLRKALASLDSYPFFIDYDKYRDSDRYKAEKCKGEPVNL